MMSTTTPAANSRHSMPNKSAYSCAKCGIVLADRQLLKTHCESMWHSHNLTLFCKGLAPLPKDIYDMYRDQHSKMEKDRNEQSDLRYECKVCDKVFGSKGTHTNHVQSQKHKNNMENQPDTSEEPFMFKHTEEESDDADQWEEFYSSDEDEEEVSARLINCFLCEVVSEDLDTNLAHMDTEHGLAIPQLERETLEQFVIFLSRKVCEYNECLSCEKVFRHATAARRHMEDKGHISVRGDAYRSLYTDAEDDIGVAGEDLQDSVVVKLNNGTVLYHRSLRPFLKQRLNSTPALALASSDTDDSEEETSCAVALAPRQVRRLQRVRHRALQRHERARLGLSVRANGMQTHFRIQVQRAG